jgi:hypothetical protein
MALSGGRALASSGQISIFEDDARVEADPGGTFQQLRLLGTDVVRLSMRWQTVAPRPNAKHGPRHFNGADPGAYPAANWGVWDAVALAGRRYGIRVDFDLMGGAPRWALGRGRPAHNSNPNWEPSAAAFGAFVHAVGLRYSGNYNPVTDTIDPGNPNDLPRVNFWSIWNEPNYGPSLAPQGVPGHLSIENSPRLYRNLLATAWRSLVATGHSPSSDTIAFGELAPRGQSNWGVFSGMTPLAFLRALYCVDSRYHPLRGGAARARGCPSTAAGSRRFRAQNPALFTASGVADHPYMRWYAPNHEPNPDPTNHLATTDYSSLAVIGHLTRALDRLVRVYGSRTKFPVYDTEFGYITSPPKRSPDPTSSVRVLYLSPKVAAAYMNWAEYLSWRDPRLRSFEQYLLYDPLRPNRGNDFGGFASGLLTWNGARKATYDAWRLPLWLPVSRARRGRSLEVWGCVRPAPLVAADTGAPQTAQIQFAPRSSGQYNTIQTVAVGAGQSCYFDVRLRLPSSGSVRLAYTYPDGDPLLGGGGTEVFSRSAAVTLR